MMTQTFWAHIQERDAAYELAHMKDEVRKVGGNGKRLVRRYNIIGTSVWCYDVYEPTEGIMNGHSTLTTIDGQWYGQLGTRPLTPKLDAMPAWSQERIDAVGAYHEAQYEEAYWLIERVYPETIGRGRRNAGGISLVV